MARVSDESRLSVPVSGQLSGVLIERWIVCDPHIHDPVVLADAPAIEATTLQQVRDLPSHNPFILMGDFQPVEDIDHQPILPQADVLEVVLARDSFLEFGEDDML